MIRSPWFKMFSLYLNREFGRRKISLIYATFGGILTCFYVAARGGYSIQSAVLK